MAIAADGAGAAGNTSTGTVTATFSTTRTNDIIAAVIMCNSGSANTVSSTTLGSWAKLGANGDGSIELWWVLASTTVTNEVLTVTCNAAFTSIFVQPFSGCNTAAPWNTGALLNSSTTFPTDPLNGTTTVANTMLVAGHRSRDTASPTAGSGWTAVTSAGFFGLLEYEAGPTVNTYSATLTTGVNDSNGSLIAALQPAAGGATAFAVTGVSSWVRRRVIVVGT